MTTDQTIDGVPREWVENYAGLLEEHHMTKDAKKVRALLDAPPPSDWELGLEDADGNELVTVRADEYAKLKAAQPRGEPVAWRYHDNAGSSPWFNGAPEQVNLEFVERRGGRIERSFAEQPAPVAVVLPPKRDTQPFTTINRGSDNYIAGWNAYANELKRLNPSL